MKIHFCVFLFTVHFSLQAQFIPDANVPEQYRFFNNFYSDTYSLSSPPAKLLQRNYGVIIGLQRGRNTFFEMGGEAHWRKMSRKNPRILGASVNMEYNFGHHIIGYKAGMWMKHGRVNLTYGGNLAYYNDFNGRSRYGLGPAVGFRLLGLHLINGYNFLAGDKELKEANTLYITLRYYFPLDNKFTWDRKDKEKRKKKKAKEKRKKQRERDRKKEDRPGLFSF